MLSKDYTQSFKGEKHPQKKSISIFLFILLFVLFGTLHITGTTYASEISVSGGTAKTSKTAKAGKASKVTEITISAAGDCTLGVDYHYNNAFNDCYKAKGSAYFLKNVKKIFSKDDITITNLEGPLTTSRNRVPSTFTFKGSPRYTSILTKGSVEVVNLANNHTRDYGTSGLSDTKKALKKSKISYCHTSTIAYKKVKGVKVAFLGFNQLSGVSKKQVKDGIGKAKKAKAKIIVVSFHWGVERTYEPNSLQKSLGRYAIRCGASLVLGHHPHVLQGIEKYKGRYIVYSLGNFCYGGHTCPADKDTMIFQQTFTIKNGKLKKDDDAKVIPCSISSVKSYNNFQPTPLSGSRKRTLIKKINRISKGKHVTVKSNGSIR